MKAVVAAFNQEKALVGAFSVITNLRMQFFEALMLTLEVPIPGRPVAGVHGAAVAPLEAELPLDAELGRVRLVLLRPRGRLGTDRCGTGGVSWDQHSYFEEMKNTLM